MIKKRKHHPNKKPTGFTIELNGVVVPARRTDELIKENDKKAADAAWNDEHDKAAHYQAIANRFRQRLEEGEVLVPWVYGNAD